LSGKLCNLAASLGVMRLHWPLSQSNIKVVCAIATNVENFEKRLQRMPDCLKLIIDLRKSLQSFPACHSNFCSLIFQLSG
jgi:hypothetical protein